MMQLPSGPPAELPIWKGRRGVINAIVCCTLSLPCAFAVWFLAERTVIVPACTAYAVAHAMIYTDFELAGVRSEDNDVVCVLSQGTGTSQHVLLENLVPFVTNALVSFAMSLQITVPAFAILLGLAMVRWHRYTAGVNGRTHH